MTTTERRGNWMQTYTGKQYWPIDPRADEVDIIDIAHALSNMCRYGGHCRTFYSVAEHSVLVSQWLRKQGHDKPIQLKGLMHDGTEAYCTDVPRPLKHMLAGYDDIEHRNWLAICERFDISPDMPQCIKDADNEVLLLEAEWLMKPHPAPWNIPGKPADVQLYGLGAGVAKPLFLQTFADLTK